MSVYLINMKRGREVYKDFNDLFGRSVGKYMHIQESEQVKKLKAEIDRYKEDAKIYVKALPHCNITLDACPKLYTCDVL